MDNGSVTTLVERRTPGSKLADVLGAEWRRWRHRRATTVGLRRGFDIRRQSTCEHRLDLAAPAVAQALDAGAGVRLISPAVYDAVDHEYRYAAKLHVPWSWPELPVWIGIAELSQSTSMLRLSLRSHRRLRYPLRYFHVAHSALGAIAQQMHSTA